MTYQERTALAHLISTIVVIGGFLYYVLSLHQQGVFNAPDGLATLGRAVLVMTAAGVVLSILAGIVVNIIAGMIHHARHGEDDDFITDERDKLLELKAMQVASYTLGIGFVLSMVALALGQSAFFIIVSLVVAGAIADIFASLTKLYLYRRGG